MSTLFESSSDSVKTFITRVLHEVEYYRRNGGAIVVKDAPELTTNDEVERAEALLNELLPGCKISKQQSAMMNCSTFMLDWMTGK